MIQAAFIAILVALIGGAGGSWFLTRNYYVATIEAARAEAIATAAAKKAEADEKTTAVVEFYEDELTKAKGRSRVIRTQIDRIVDRPVYVGCIVDPDGVRLFNDAASGVVRMESTAGDPGAVSPVVGPPE